MRIQIPEPRGGARPKNRMKVRPSGSRPGKLLGVVAAALVLAVAPATAQNYVFSATGPIGLGGGQTLPGGVNELGEVTGTSELAPNVAPQFAFIYGQGATTQLPTLGGIASLGVGINDAGTVVGYSAVPGNAYNHAFSYSNGTMTDLTPGTGNGYAYAVNGVGTIVGESDAPSIAGAFVFSNGVMTGLNSLGGNPGGTLAAAFALNDAGEIVGTEEFTGPVSSHAFSYSNGAVSDLGTLPGGNMSSAFGVNLGGVIVGSSNRGDGTTHAFLYVGGAMGDMGTLGGSNSTALAINNQGTIVGQSDSALGSEAAFVTLESQMSNLNTLVNLPGVNLVTAAAINNLNQIVVQSDTGSVYLLTPLATHLSVVAQPTATAGTPVYVMVTALDAFDNPVPGYPGSVELTSSDASAVYSAPGAQLVNGSGIFVLTLNTAGTQTVTATDLNSPAITGTSAGIAVSYAAVAITAQPQSLAVAAGASATFSVGVAAGSQATYQWLFNNAAIPGATGSTYTIPSAQVSNSGGYSVTLTNPSGSVASQVAFLTVSAPSGAPVITGQPASLTINPEGTVVLSVGTGGTVSASAVASPRTADASATTYQWFFDGTPLADGGGTSGSQSAVLTLTGAATRGGVYHCLVENAEGASLSDPATLSVSTASDPGRLVNLSCRAVVGTGSNILITGFIVGGVGTSGAEPLLVRASGPALQAFGVQDVLADPDLQLFSTTAGSTLLATNSGWGGAEAIATAATHVGAFAWTDPSSHDAALVRTLPAGAYTANIGGSSADSGVALAEIYDTSPPGTYTPASSRLINVSARAQVGTGANVLIAGFVIGGSTARTVLIRASGPALEAFGVTGTLSDPELDLFGTASGNVLVATNTGWNGNTAIMAAAADVGAFSWGSTATGDSAILVTLPAGPYTANVTGASGDTGNALVEVYEVQ